MPERARPQADLPLLWEMGEDLHRLFLAQERRRTAAGLRTPRWLRTLSRLRTPPRLRTRQGFAALNVRLAVALAVLLAVAAAVALADGLLSGAPVSPPFAPQPTKGDGAPVGASATLLALSVADPAGGLPWGLRLVSTTRGAGCLQYGRLYDGQLGVLGEDGAFGDDHRFHPLSPQDAVTGFEGCGALDADGRLFEAVQSQEVPASAYPQACMPHVDYERGARAPGDPGIPFCPAGDERALFYGALGPDVKSITYSLATDSETVKAPGRGRELTTSRTVYALGGATVTVPTVGPQGAYLIVAEHLPGAASGITGPDAPDSSATLPSGQYQPIRAITYSDGTVCHIGATLDRNNRGQPCAPIGMVALPRPTPAEVRAPLSALILFDHPDPPLQPEDVVQVSFVARAPITSTASYYAIAMRDPCRGASSGATIDEDVAPGRRLTFTLGMSVGPPGSKPCRGMYTGEVYYGNKSTHLPFLGSGLVVGRFSVRLP
ncbi:MAG: hypothetical protein ACLP1Q_20025 [Solirubrobacteraceae bacterium]